MVKIISYQGKQDYYSVGFGVVGENEIGTNYDTKIIVNENPYELMNTVFSIMEKFSKDRNIKGFIFSLTDDDKSKNNQRLLLYKRTLQKYFPNSKLELLEGIYYIHL